jgi:hypothetical protein
MASKAGCSKTEVPNPACRLEKNPLAGLEAQRRWGPTAQNGILRDEPAARKQVFGSIPVCHGVSR